MKKFLTYMEASGNNIYYRYVKDGVDHEEVVKNFPIHLYLLDENGESVSLYGDKLHAFEFNGIQAARDFCDDYSDIHGQKVFGNQTYLQHFVRHAYKNGQIDFDMAAMRIASFDIEVEHDNGFPEPEDANDVVMSISIKDFGGESTCYGLLDDPEIDDLSYTKCSSESELLYRFMNHVRENRYHVLTGWNVIMFDVPYLVNRIEKICGEGEADGLSVFANGRRRVIKSNSKKDIKGNERTTYDILGITVLDMMELYKKFNPTKQESYRLDFIGEAEEVGRKVDYSQYNGLMDLYRRNPRLFFEYNDQDNRLVELINDKKKFIELGLAISVLTRSKFSDCMSTVSPWDNLIYHMAEDDNLVVPPKKKNKATNNAGGYVKESLLGIHRWIVTLDLTSLYPSIIRMLNLSPETQIGAPMGRVEMVDRLINGEIDLREYRDADTCIAVNGATFKRNVDGIIPRAMKFVGDERKRYKNLKKSTEIELEALYAKRKEGVHVEESEIERLQALISLYDLYQLAMKVVGNGGYGATGNVGFRYFEPAVTEAVTVTGQYVIKWIGFELNKFLNAFCGTIDHDYVIVSDTDSAYISVENFVKMVDPDGEFPADAVCDMLDVFVREKIEPFLEERFASLCDMLNGKINTLDMKREAIGDVILIRGKKNYAMRMYHMEEVRYTDPYLKIAGIEVKRSDKPMICRDAMKESIPIIFDKTEADLQKFCADFKKEFMRVGKADIAKIATPKGVSNLVWEEGDEAYNADSDNAYHAKAAIAYNAMLEKNTSLQSVYEYIKSGDKVKLIPLRMPNPAHNKLLAFQTDIPKEFGMERYIDYNEQYKKAFLSPVESLAKLVGWNCEKVDTLDFI